jgi:hypothetical protein
MSEPTSGSWEFGAIRVGDGVRIEVTAQTSLGEPVTISIEVSRREALLISESLASAAGAAYSRTHRGSD